MPGGGNKSRAHLVSHRMGLVSSGTRGPAATIFSQRGCLSRKSRARPPSTRASSRAGLMVSLGPEWSCWLSSIAPPGCSEGSRESDPETGLCTQCTGVAPHIHDSSWGHLLSPSDSAPGRGSGLGRALPGATSPQGSRADRGRQEEMALPSQLKGTWVLFHPDENQRQPPPAPPSEHIGGAGGGLRWGVCGGNMPCRAAEIAS